MRGLIHGIATAGDIAVLFVSAVFIAAFGSLTMYFFGTETEDIRDFEWWNNDYRYVPPNRHTQTGH